MGKSNYQTLLILWRCIVWRIWK